MSRDELEDALEAMERPRFHGRQIHAAVMKRCVATFAKMTDLSKDLRTELESHWRVATSTVETVQRSDDGTVKLLIRLEDGRFVESVIIPEGDRVTVCISTEVGCQARCTFCASGLEGLIRPLGSYEIVEQILHVRRELADRGPGPITNVVLMGMGEPLLNYEATLAAVNELCNPETIALGARRITLSTVGIVEGMDRLRTEKRSINLAVSLHAPDDKTRSEIVPLNRKYGVEAVVGACHRYARDTGRDVTFEYVLLAGVNDSPAQADLLGRHAVGAHINVNLIPFNAVEGLPYASPSPAAVEAFSHRVASHGVPVHVRRQRGEDIDAACGQLRLKKERGSA
jgi:23S rRNA (adenine2503-C2)-methyltransferase